MALDGAGRVVDEEVYYSVGGGFVVDADHAESGATGVTEVRVELPFDSGEELLKICDLEGLSIAEVMGRNERAWRPDGRTRDGLLAVWEAMRSCVARGIRSDGVLHYFMVFQPGAGDDDVVDFLLTAAAVGSLLKRNASISGAEVGCQGEVGSACGMAAAGLTQVLGGTALQVENAAEIGLEHNLGLTCDPVAGLVQVPCIERNAMAAVKAINAAQLALGGDGRHHITLDQAIRTMRDTGRDMLSKYKETSEGGLAVAFIEC